jgi:hypothetical protein
VIEARVHDEPRTGANERIRHRGLSCRARSVVVRRECRMWDVRARRAHERRYAGAVRRHEDDARREAAVCARIEDRLEIRATA